MSHPRLEYEIGVFLNSMYDFSVKADFILYSLVLIYRFVTICFLTHSEVLVLADGHLFLFVEYYICKWI